MKADPTHDPHFITDPHIPIARKLQPWQYEKGRLEYAHEHFSGMFMANDMLLLKRPAGGRAYSVVKRFEFQNLPVAMKQGALFT
ncbi:MAG TPA: hypothetical protein VLC98_03950 [Phnomibacter sp.]|nr:hypothetical protein [Phnomibacter sp.]